MSFELPIFPLGLVLFPGMPLPLHIFEPRYRTMIGRCLEEDNTFGVALIVDGEEGQSDTFPAAIGCTAEIVDAQQLPDGRMNLQTVGRRRFRILSIREQDDYFIGNVEWLDDESTEEDAPILSSQALRSLRRYLGAIGAGIETPLQDEWNVPTEPVGVSMWIGALLAAPNAQKQQLLETNSTRERLTLEIQLLRRAEVIQNAFVKRQSWLEPDLFDETTQNYAPFLSLN
ncbi:MAG TPA: LON peptidase substrate-binding domain-containing protein [Abditibacteriaceae bacterium]|jgi:Lon protease-like protein